VHVAIQQLPVEFREIVLLRKYEELSCPPRRSLSFWGARRSCRASEGLDRDFERRFPTPRWLAIGERRNLANEPLP
jgi:hypothetical protein